MEQHSGIKRSDMWKKIYNVVNKIPRKTVEYDASDVPSVTTELEELFSNLIFNIEEENKKLKFIIENGLGEKDLDNDCL